jgi:hypothetical protein
MGATDGKVAWRYRRRKSSVLRGIVPPFDAQVSQCYYIYIVTPPSPHRHDLSYSEADWLVVAALKPGMGASSS